jgi:hypothetical protein
LDHRQVVIYNGQEGGKGVRSLGHKRIEISEGHPFSLSPSIKPET